MAKISPQSSKPIERTAIKKGKHILTLVAVNPYERENKFKGGKKENRLAWVFEADGTDDPLNPGHPIQYTEFTGTEYGFDLARLTTLLDWLLPDTEPEYREHVDTDDIIGRKFTAAIQIKDNDDGSQRPIAMFMEPLAGNTATSQNFEPKGATTTDLPFDPEAVGTETPAASLAVSDDVKAALGAAMHKVAAAPNTDQARFKADILTELGRLRYSSYSEFIDKGQKDALAVLLFVQNWGLPK